MSSRDAPSLSALAAAACFGAAAAATVSVALNQIAKSRRRRELAETSARGYESSVGDTPLVKLHALSALTGRTILAKCEFLNPGGSTKDRIAREIILDAEARGDLPKGGGGTVTEGTSGSTGISLTLMARSRGHRCVIVMPDDVSKGKSDLLERFGADVQRVKSAAITNDGHYVNVARRLASNQKGAFFADQFESPSNFKAHYRTTGPEIWRQCAGRVDAFVMGAGTGGTISGVARYLKEQTGGRVRVVLADPPGSALARRVNHGVLYAPEQAERTMKRHRYDTIVEGVGLSRLTANFRKGLDAGDLDRAFSVTDAESVQMSRFLLEREGLFVGSSSGMNCCAAVKAAREMPAGSVLVTILCDGGQRHLSRFWNDDHVRSWGVEKPSPPSAGRGRNPLAFVLGHGAEA
jgi:cysteine synthase A